MKRFLIVFAVIVFGFSSIIIADEQTNYNNAAESAKAAANVLEQAEKAHKATQEALKAAREAAKNAEAAAEKALITLQEQKRKERVAGLAEPPQPPTVEGKTFNAIDSFIVNRWPQNSDPKPCSDEVFLRRAFLDIVGYIPKPDEVTKFLKEDDPNKRAKLIDQLLTRDEDYAAHWSQFWEDALCSNGKHQGGVGTRANFRPFIIESFRQNKPYDVFVTQLLDPNVIGHYGGYVKSKDHLESTQTAANIGQVFLGTRMKCASCHDHFLNYEWSQKRFLGFASFFNKEDLEVIRCEVKHGEFIKPMFMFDNGAVDPNKLDSLDKRLAAVSNLIVDPANPRFAASFINRLWKRSTGLGLVEPVDDFREDTPASHSKLLAWLSYEFAASGYDVKHMIRLIMNSRTYQLEFNEDYADVWREGEDAPRYFRSPAQRRLTCEQVLDSIAAAVGLKRQRTTFDENSTPLTRSLGKPETRNEVITTRSEDVAVIQSLQLMNSPEFHEMIYGSPLPGRLAKTKDREEALRLAYLRVLSREPNDNERDALMAHLGGQPGADEWGDLVWALASSPQFHYIN